MSSSMKRPSVNLSLLTDTISTAESTTKSPTSSTTRSNSPRNFDGGVVGLGIVAAMSDDGGVTTNNKPYFSSRSQPIPIVLPKLISNKHHQDDDDDDDDDEIYTCVISHLGSIKEKTEYHNLDDLDGGICKPGVFFTSPLKNTRTLFQTDDFLSCCYLCRKKLLGQDIFMYRGDKAFCSAECRYKQILIDEQRARCGSGKLKSYAYSVSPCSAPRIFSTGVAAA